VDIQDLSLGRIRNIQNRGLAITRFFAAVAGLRDPR